MEIRVKGSKVQKGRMSWRGRKLNIQTKQVKSARWFHTKRFTSYYNVFLARLGQGAEHPSGDSHVTLQQPRDLPTAGRDPLGEEPNPGHNTGCWASYVAGCTYPPDAGPAGGAVVGLGDGCTSLPRTGQVTRQGFVGAVVGGRWGNRERFEAGHLGSGGKDGVGRLVVDPREC